MGIFQVLVRVSAVKGDPIPCGENIEAERRVQGPKNGI